MITSVLSEPMTENHSPFMSCHEPPPPGQFKTPEKVLQKFLQIISDNITQDDITKVCQEVLRPVTELAHKTTQQEYFHNKVYDKSCLMPNTPVLRRGGATP